MPGYVWIIIIVVAVVIVIAIIRSASAPKGDYRKQQPGLSFGALDRALQKDHKHREEAEFTIAIDMGEIDAMIESGDYKLAKEKVREVIEDAEDRQDTVVIANMMGYLEKIELAKKRRY